VFDKAKIKKVIGAGEYTAVLTDKGEIWETGKLAECTTVQTSFT
jgi:hypothetical protein